MKRKALLFVLFLVFSCSDRGLEEDFLSVSDIGYSDIQTFDIYNPVYFSENLVKTKDDLVFVKVKDRTTGEIKNFFAIGYDSHSDGPWDGISGADQCYRDSTGKAYGFYDNAEELNLKAAESGANFVYVWSGEDKLSTTPRLYGRWLESYNSKEEKEWRSIPIIYNGGGEPDMDSKRQAAIEN